MKLLQQFKRRFILRFVLSTGKPDVCWRIGCNSVMETKAALPALLNATTK
jgi:hypothetical protein